MTVDCAIVGAGPAGLSAAAVLAAAGLSTLVLDEFPIPGGRLCGQSYRLPDGTLFDGAGVAETLLRHARKSGAVLRVGVSVVAAERCASGFQIDLVEHRAAAIESLTARMLIIATGASEVGVPVPGWTLPGVLTVGAAQVLTRVHGVHPGGRGLIVGINPLSLVVALELLADGVQIAGIVAAPALQARRPGEDARIAVARQIGRLAHLAPAAWMRIGRLLESPNAARLALPWLRRGFDLGGARLLPARTVRRIEGQGRVEAAWLCDLGADGLPTGSDERLAVDFVLVSGGLTPLSELARVLGVPAEAFAGLGGLVPLHARSLRTRVPGLYLAGNICGIESAAVAMAQGQLAAAALLQDCAHPGAAAMLETALQDLDRTRAHTPLVFQEGAPAARADLYARFGREVPS